MQPIVPQLESRRVSPAAGEAPGACGRDEVSSRGLALVVEDDETSGLLLKETLKSEGFDVVWARDGEQAVTAFQAHRPGLVFMDIMMPAMDGYEAAKHIKALDPDVFTPVLFVTALDGEEAFARSIEAGGDDFIPKPVKPAVLRSKVAAMERIRDLQRRVLQEREHARALYERLEEEQVIASEIFERAVRPWRAEGCPVRWARWSAAEFNGDLVLHARRPCGAQLVLLGDFTGNGLRAAIGAVPVSEMFRDMAEKGHEAPDILKQLDRRLRTLLPSDMFMAVLLAEVSASGGQVSVWNGGMPSALVLGQGGIKGRIPSAAPPLGINALSTRSFTPHTWDVAHGDRILMYSDGALGQCACRDGSPSDWLERLVEQAEADTGFDRVRDAIAERCGAESPADDITVVDVPLDRPHDDHHRPGPTQYNECAGMWRWALELHAGQLRETDPMPLVVNQLKGLDVIEGHRQSLTLVVYELFSNALEHGVLGLDSSLKATEEGFEYYYQQRAERLAALTSGFVRLDLLVAVDAGGGRIVVRVADSGDGFDYETVLREAAGDVGPERGHCGRGVALVKRLCESLTYLGVGSEVEAVYAW